MITTDFSRTFLREGYDMSEVRAFLADVERTIKGQVSEADQIVTAQKAEEIEFSVKLREKSVLIMRVPAQPGACPRRPPWPTGRTHHQYRNRAYHE